MSSTTRTRLTPVQLATKGETVLSLTQMLGPEGKRMLETTLEELQKPAWLETELRLQPGVQAARLGWQKLPDTYPVEYRLALPGAVLPESLRQGSAQRLEVTLRVGEGIVQLSHNLQTTRPVPA